MTPSLIYKVSFSLRKIIQFTVCQNKAVQAVPNIILEQNIYSCPMKTHHSSDAHICGLSNAVPNCVIYNCYLEQMQCFRANVSIPVTPLTHDVTSASILCKLHFGRIQKDPKISF